MSNADCPYSRYRRAPPLPQVKHDILSTASLIDVDSPHVSSVPSDYSGETSTQAERQEREAEEAEREAKAKFEEVSNATKEKTHKGKEVAGEKYQKGKEVASEKGKQAKAKTEKKRRELDRNKDNPVVVGNMVLIGLGSAALGYVPLILSCVLRVKGRKRLGAHLKGEAGPFR